MFKPRSLTLLAIALSLALFSSNAVAQTDQAVSTIESAHESASPSIEFIRAALDADGELKPGIDQQALRGHAAQLSQRVLEASRATGGIAKGDVDKPAVRAALARRQAMLDLLATAGRAAPRLFLTPAGKSAADNFWSLIDRAENYQSELEADPNAMGRLHDMNNLISRAQRAYNGLSLDDKISANGQAMVRTLYAKIDFMNGVQQARQGQAELEGRAKQACKSFDATHGDGVSGDRLFELSKMLQGTYSGSLTTLNDASVAQWTERVRQARQAATSVLEVCADPEQMKLLELCKPTHGKPRLEGLYADRDPVVWCMAAEKTTELFAQELSDFIAQSDEYTVRTIKTPQQLQTSEGYFSDDLLKDWDQLLTMTDEKKDEILALYKPLYDELGVDMPPADQLFAGRLAALKTLRDAVTDLAPTLKAPPAGKSHYGASLAKKRMQKRFRGAKIHAVYDTSADWKVTVNALGVPQYRDRGGWILLKVPGEPFCQLRTWGISEDWTGSSYQRARGVRFGSLRWQACK